MFYKNNNSSFNQEINRMINPKVTNNTDAKKITAQ